VRGTDGATSGSVQNATTSRRESSRPVLVRPSSAVPLPRARIRTDLSRGGVRDRAPGLPRTGARALAGSGARNARQASVTEGENLTSRFTNHRPCHRPAEAGVGLLLRAGDELKQQRRPGSRRVGSAGGFRGLRGMADWSGVASRRRIEPCMRFSRTRLSDIVHRLAYASVGFTVPVRR
jgi:hypothetical protein